jgi:hypothetical protein
MKTIFIPVPVSNLPENNIRHFVLTKRQSGNTEVVSEKRASFHGGKWVDDTLFDGEEVTAWLREVEVPEGLPSDEEIDLIEQPHLTTDEEIIAAATAMKQFRDTYAAPLLASKDAHILDLEWKLQEANAALEETRGKITGLTRK